MKTAAVQHNEASASLGRREWWLTPQRAIAQAIVLCLLGYLGVGWCAESSSRAASLVSSTGSPLSSSLVVPSADQLLDGQEQRAAAQALWSSPEAVELRAKSMTEYEHETPAQAATTLGTAFPSVIDESDGGPPQLPAGAKALGFETADVETLDLPGGQPALVQSTVPIAVHSSSGAWSPVDLGLRSAGASFEASTPVVPVEIPKHLGSGVQLPAVGISLTPVDSTGAALSGSEGVADGAAVLFTNTETDSDTVLKPSTMGVEASTVLRSVDSPQTLYYRVGLPQGASLVQAANGTLVRVLEGGATVAIITPPTAQDAAGTPVHVSMSVSGTALVVSVAHRSASYQYPIIVDPEMEQLWENVTPGNWYFHELSGYKYEKGGAFLYMRHEGPFPGGDYGEWSATTEGYTKMYEVYIKDVLEGAGQPYFSAWIELYKEKTTEQRLSLSSPYRTEATICAEPVTCSEEAGSNGNGERFGVSTVEERTPGPSFYGFATQISTAISEERGKYSTTEYETTAKTLKYRNAKGEEKETINALATPGVWIGPGTGAFEFTSKDGGLGIAETKVEYYGAHGWEAFGGKNYQTEGSSCVGVQCAQEEHDVYTYENLVGSGGKHLPQGEDKIRVSARSPLPYTTTSEYKSVETTIKVDSEGPHGITLTGLAGKGTELELGELEAHVKVEATDGEGSTPSSGVASLAIEVDQKQVGQSHGSCPSGPCTASAEWAINGTELGTGVHQLTVVATDNAGNIEPKTYQLTVYHASPVAMGPGSVNPESGDFAMEASDVSLSGGTGALSVTRHYDSLNVKEGEEGPLGPQWTISLGSLASLEVLPDNSVMTIGPAGLTHFTTKMGGGFEAPQGDHNIKLEYIAEYEGKEPAYVLKNESEGTTTVFRLPKGAKSWMPSTSKGPITTDTMTDEYRSIEIGEGKTIVEPTLELAPHPSVTCEKEHLADGCRGLEFVYDEGETTAKGEAQSEWGTYKHRLGEVIAVAYNPTTKAMAKTAVAKYEYDKRGRLRVEWDPRVPSPLKSVYGYDAEGHVTAVTPPGQQPWLLTYGSTEGDISTGRLLAATRPSANTPLGNGQAPVVTEQPKLSTKTPTVGEKVTVTTGTWTGALAYSYQWYGCHPEKVGLVYADVCIPIAGATNPSYTPLVRDKGQALMAEVHALNASGGSVGCSGKHYFAEESGQPAHCGYTHEELVGNTGTLTEEPIPPPPPLGSNAVWTVEYGVPLSGASLGLPNLTSTEVAKWGEKDTPVTGAAVFPPDEPMGWPAADYKRATIHYMDSRARTVNTANPAGGIATSEYNESNEVTRSLSADSREVALKEPKPAEASELLDTKSAYNAQSELTDTWGPQHTVKLAKGKTEANETAQARSHVHYTYDEGAPAGETYELVTKTVAGAETPSHEEFDKRVTATSYSGQSNLGWKFRRPTSETTDPGGLDLVHSTVYDPTTGNVTETKTPGSNAETVYPPVYSGVFGTSGSGQVKEPEGTATDASGNVWVADTANNRVVKYSASGSFLAEYGTSGSRSFSGPWGIAINQSTGNVYVSDTGNNRIEELNSSGALVAIFGWGVTDGKAELETCTASCKAGISGSGNGQLTTPLGLTIDGTGNVWVTDDGNNRVQEFSSSGAYIGQFGTKGSGNGQFNMPTGVAISEGQLYVVDYGNNRVEEFSAHDEYLSQFGTVGTAEGQLKEPVGIAANPTTGVLFVSDFGNSRVQEFSPAGKPLTSFGWYGTGKDQFGAPKGLAVNASGDIYVADATDNRVSEWLPPGAGGAHLAYSSTFGTVGSGEGQLSFPAAAAIDGSGNVWVTDYSNNRVEKFSAAGKYLASYGKAGSGELQFNGPTGIDINQSTGNVYVADCGNNRIEELSSSGAYVRSFGKSTAEPAQLSCPGGVKVDASGNVWVADTHNNRIQEFSATGTYVSSYGTLGSGEVQFNEPIGITISGGNLYIADAHNDRVEELSSAGKYLGQFGSEGPGSGQFRRPESITADSAGNIYVVDNGGGDRFEEFTASGTFLAEYGAPGSGEGQLSEPNGITINAAGSIYIADSANNRIEHWTTTNQAVHNTKTTYYTAKEEASVKACRNHPEWVGLPCQTEPAAQPKTPGVAELPITTITYNMWDQAETTEETIGTITRTKKTEFDAAGRPLATEEKTTSTENQGLQKVTDTYNTENGSLKTQSTTTGETTKTITTLENTLGQLETYTDADGNKAKYTYDVDGRPTEVADGSEEGKGAQKYEYDKVTGELTHLIDSGAGNFTATYDVSGKMLTESYPNGMTAYHTYNAEGAATALEYKKLTHCTEKCTWITDSIVPSIHGEILSQASTLAEEPSYTYDAAGRLTQVQEVPSGEGCKTRIYSYDEESNRTALTTREPGTGGKCATEGGSAEHHTYDSANRLTDPETTYDPLGNITSLPAADSGGTKLTSSYYADNQLFTQSQGTKTLEYKLDPEDRTRETISSTTGKSISHYDAPGQAMSWTSEPESKWTRDIPGIAGELAAVETNPATVVLELHDLQGNIIATASPSETETKLLSKYNSSEFGVPTTKEAPPKYAWLGATGLSSELASGTITQDGSTYVPQLGMPLQTQTVALPIPVNAGVVFTDPAPAWVAEEAGSGGALSIAEAEQARKAAGQVGAEQLEDPTVHYRAWESSERGEKLIKLSAAGDLTEALGAVFGTVADYLDGWIEAHATTEVAFTWLEEYGQFLQACVRELHAAKDAHGGCSASYDDIAGLPDFWVKPKISYCLVGRDESRAIDGLGLSNCTLLAYEEELPPFFT